MARTELDLAVSVRKAISPDETAPKRKHVRSCIVYTWDHKSSGAFWQAMKIQPILSDQVQTFKALICIHKLLQEGHPVCLREAQPQASWIDSLGRGYAGDDYGVLIREYASFLIAKLRFHKDHPEFNGMLEYEEYVTLKTTMDPNEGYETVSNLMSLQDQMDSFQKLIFSHFRHSITNECKIAALVPLVQESYGIYRFITSMLRAMFQASELAEVLEPLEKRYNSQFHRLVNFYYECSNLRYLSRLITLPKLPERAVDLRTQQTNLYLGLQPEEKLEEIETQNPATSSDDVSAEITLQSKPPDPFHDQTNSHMIPANRSRFEVLPEMKFLTFDESPSSHAAWSKNDESVVSSILPNPNPSEKLIQNYEARIGELENTLTRMQSTAAANSTSTQSNLQQAMLRADMWANKYENLAQLYTRLRREHLGTIEKAKELDDKLKEQSNILLRCKSLQKALQDKSVLLLSVEREKAAVLAKLERFQQGINDSQRIISTEDSTLAARLQEKDDEIAIMKEAFEQSLLEMETVNRECGTIRDDLLKTIETVLRTCRMHVTEAKTRFNTSFTDARFQSPEHLTRTVEECGVLLSHLPDLLGSTQLNLIAENCLDFAHGIGRIVLYTNIFGNQVTGKDKHTLDAIIEDIMESTRRLFLDLSERVSKCYPQSMHSDIAEMKKLQELLFQLSSFLETSGFSRDAGNLSERSNIREDLQTALECAADAVSSAEKLEQRLGSVEYTFYEINVSNELVRLAKSITASVAELLEKAAEIEDQLLSDLDAQSRSKNVYNLSGSWTNGFISASKAVAGAISVLINVADGVLRNENDIEQLEVATKNVISAATQVVVAARIKLDNSLPLRAELERATASVISSCRSLNSQIRESMDNSGKSKLSVRMSPYEIKVAEMDQQVKIVQLETALESARLRLTEIRKLSYA